MTNEQIKELAEEAARELAKDKEGLFHGEIKYAAEYVLLKNIRETYARTTVSRDEVLSHVREIVEHCASYHKQKGLA